MKYPVNEIFKTIQAEGTYSGTPSLFVRLQGCDVGCGWCDTKHTWKVDSERKIDIVAVAKKVEESESFGMFSCDDIINKLDGLGHVVITGGEPCIYDLSELTGKLISLGNTVQIETSGTQEVKADKDTWVTVSPKIGMAGGFNVLDSAISRANEIKMPVGKKKDLDNLSDLNIGKKIVYLQPLSLSIKATKICIDYAMECNYRVSIQWHKYIDLR